VGFRQAGIQLNRLLICSDCLRELLTLLQRNDLPVKSIGDGVSALSEV